LVRGELEMAGHRVIEAATAEEALSRIAGSGVGLVLAGADLREAMRQHTSLAEISVVELPGSASGRESMLASIAQLSAAVNTPEVLV
jgi:hypothetical protein